MTNFQPSYTLSTGKSLSRNFHPKNWADLQASGLDGETIRLGQVHSLAPRFIEKFFRVVPAKIESALCFPYQGGDFARIKIFPAIDRMKYVQPPGTSARLYVPQQPADGRLLVAEGEKKTLSAVQYGLNAIGIGGVWSWVRKGSPIDDLDLIEWDGRDVEVVPDSDICTRPDLMRAIYALSRELESRGAYVTLVMLPQGDESKIGLDDYFVSGATVEDFEALDRVELRQDPLKRCRTWYTRWRIEKELAA